MMTENPNVTLVIPRSQNVPKGGVGGAYQTMVQRIRNPEPESGLCEEHILLAQDVELRIPIQDSGGDELVKDTDNERRQDGENDVIEGQRP